MKHFSENNFHFRKGPRDDRLLDSIKMGASHDRVKDRKKLRSRLQVSPNQRHTYRVLQTIQMKLILLCVWAEQAVLGKLANSNMKFEYVITYTI